MAVSKQSPAPYAPGSAVIGIIRRYREKGLATPFTAEVLARSGVSESLVPRTIQALVALDLINDKGMPTPLLDKMRTVAEKDFQSCLADWIKSAYADAFQFIDPATDDAVSIRDAFRSYNPTGQQDRMVALFMALCAEAGLVDESKKSEAKPVVRKSSPPRSTVSRVVMKPATRGLPPTHPAHGVSHSLHPALAGFINSLPPQGVGWTKDQRDKFVATFPAVLDFAIPVDANLPTTPEANERETP